MKVNGGYVVLVFGGFIVFIVYVVVLYGFDENCVNILLIDGGKFIGDVGCLIFGCEVKVEVLNEIIICFGFIVEDVMVVGDGVNDFGMFGFVGVGVVLYVKFLVVVECDICINYGDFIVLFYL